MKKLYYLLFSLLVFSTSVLAQSPHSISNDNHASGSTQHITQASTQALQLTCYLTEALRLTQNQAAAVRQATLLQLVQQNKSEGASVAVVSQRYDASMLQILTPGQYAAFRLLQDQHPITSLLLHTASTQVVQR